ncbi:MAG: diaminopimelate dehydrogenase [Treponemataceae bacterium]
MKIAILGYGNLAKGIECCVKQNPDCELTAVFTRRDPCTVKILTQGIPVYKIEEIEKHKQNIDVLVLCGGSATDLPFQTPKYAKYFNIIDSFDTHARIPEHFENVDKAARSSNHTALISCGWDPGLFSLMRLYGNCILPQGNDYTFWGKGVSQGHSDAIRRVKGVKNGKQYTIPVQKSLEQVRKGENPDLSPRQKHTRECFLVLEDWCDQNDKDRIEKEIKEMPNYFADYDTTVNFISEKEFEENHSKIAHGGFVFRSGITGWDNEFNNIVEYSLKLDSNPAFTASVITAFARAVYKMNKEGIFGCKTVFDVPPAYLSPLSSEELRKLLL